MATDIFIVFLKFLCFSSYTLFVLIPFLMKPVSRAADFLALVRSFARACSAMILGNFFLVLATISCLAPAMSHASTSLSPALVYTMTTKILLLTW